MLSVGLLAIEHHAQVRDPLARIPSPQEIIAGSQWIAEPYSGPLAEAKEARKRQDAFLKAELIIIALKRSIDRAAAIARPQPEEAFDALCAAARALLSLGEPDERQTHMADTIAERIATGLQYTHKRGHEQQFERFQEAIPSLTPNPRVQIREIKQDRHGRRLRRDTKERVNRLALQLAKLGYRQADSRPTLFRLHFRGFTAYVDFDSTEVIDMWDVDCQPGVYAFHRNEWEDPEPLAALVRRHLIDNGIEPRIYFEDHSAITDDCYTCEQIEAGKMSNLEGWSRAIDQNDGQCLALPENARPPLFFGRRRLKPSPDAAGRFHLLHQVVVPFALGLQDRLGVVGEGLNQVVAQVHVGSGLPDGVQRRSR